MKQIPLTQGQFAIVDDEDFEEMSSYRWYAVWSPPTKSFYAERHLPRRKNWQGTIKMHQHLMRPAAGLVVDHINHDTLDNRRGNLRLCTRAQNQANRRGAQANSRTGIRGVCWSNQAKKWMVRVGRKYIGIFDRIDAAADAAMDARRKIYGEFCGG